MVYSDTRPEDLSLRDHLARDRTVLSNERTLLSYLRTSFGFAAGGVTLVKLFPSDAVLNWIGIALVFLGGVTRDARIGEVCRHQSSPAVDFERTESQVGRG